MQRAHERNQDATLYVGGLDDQCSEAILWELFTQAGPVVNVHMPKDRITGCHQGYGFVEFSSEEDADYAMRIMNMVKLYGKSLRANKASANLKNQDIGANLFIGNLDPEVDEKLLYDTFASFGPILQGPKVQRDLSNNNPRCYAFINYASFEASDTAIEAMNGQYFSNRPISVGYAFKKDGKGEKHGTMVERLLAQKNKMMQEKTLGKPIETAQVPAYQPPLPIVPPPPPPDSAMPLSALPLPTMLPHLAGAGSSIPMLPSMPQSMPSMPGMPSIPGLSPGMSMLNPLAMNPMMNPLLMGQIPPPPPSPPPPPTPPPPES